LVISWTSIEILLIAKEKIKTFYLLCGRLDFPETFFFSFSSFSFLRRILCTLKTFCSGELCTSYSWQLHSHLWSWMRSLVHILFYLSLWSGFLWFFKVVFLFKGCSTYNILRGKRWHLVYPYDIVFLDIWWIILSLYLSAPSSNALIICIFLLS
jgi:hypothetical protein